MKSENKNFIKVADGVYVLHIPFFGGAYFTAATLVLGDEIALIDSGDAAETVDGCIVPALSQLGLKPCDVGLLLCTHTHGDHINGHIRFKELSGCRTVVTRLMAERAVFPYDEIVDDGCIVGKRLRPVYTPGHSTDAVCWLDEQTNTLISGDSFQADGTYGVGLALIDDPRQYEQSVKLAAALLPETVVAGHAFAPFEVVVRKEQIKEFFDRCVQTAENYGNYISRRCAEGVTAVQALTRELIDRFGRRYDRYIVRGDCTVKAFLRSMKI